MVLTLKSLRYFASAANLGSISAASAKLNVVPSAVLAAVNQVEQDLNLQLLTRKRSQGIVLTPTGHMLMKKIARLLEDYDSLIHEGADLQTRLVGKLTVGYYAPMAPAFLPSIIHQLIDNNPSVSVELIECDNQQAQAGLVNGLYDVIICISESIRPEIRYHSLTDLYPYVLCSESHPLANRSQVALEELADQPFVLLNLPAVSAYYGRIFDKAGLSPKVVVTATSVEMVRSLVGASLGCSILHMRPTIAATYAGQFVKGVPIRPNPDPLRLVLGYLPDRPRRIVETFVRMIRLLFESEAVKAFVVSSRQ